jgi:hypothetical protein
MSAPDFPEERKVVDAGRIPVDGLYKSIFKAFPSEINEADIPSPTTATPTTSTSPTATPPLGSRANTPVSSSPQLQIPEAAKARQDSKRGKKKKKKSKKA